MRLARGGVPLIVVALWSGSARSQEQELQEKIAKMNRAAFLDIGNREWPAAKKKLLDALVVERQSGLEKHPLMARTYVTLGVVHIMGFGNREQALKSFRHGLEIQPDIRLVRSMPVTAEVDDAFEEAGGRPWPQRHVSSDEFVEPDLPARVAALDCSYTQRTWVNEAVAVRCALAPGLPVTKVFLFYREPVKQRFTEVEMKRTPKGWFKGRIPERVVYGQSLQFYFEGRNAAGKPIVRHGEQESPDVIVIERR